MERKSLLPLIKNVSYIVWNTTEEVKRKKIQNSNRGIFSEGALDRVIGIVSKMEENSVEYKTKGIEPGE